jgi:hypothetical protein
MVIGRASLANQFPAKKRMESMTGDRTCVEARGTGLMDMLPLNGIAR